MWISAQKKRLNSMPKWILPFLWFLNRWYRMGGCRHPYTGAPLSSHTLSSLSTSFSSHPLKLPLCTVVWLNLKLPLCHMKYMVPNVIRNLGLTNVLVWSEIDTDHIIPFSKTHFNFWATLCSQQHHQETVPDTLQQYIDYFRQYFTHSMNSPAHPLDDATFGELLFAL